MGIFFGRRNESSDRNQIFTGPRYRLYKHPLKMFTIGAFVTELRRPKKMPMNSFNAALIVFFIKSC